MAKVNLRSGKATSFPLGVLLGLSVSWVITVIGSVIATWCVLNGILKANIIGYMAMVILVLSAVCGPLTAIILIKRRKILVCLITGAAYYLSLLLVNGLLLGAHFQGVGVTGIMVVAGIIFVIIPVLNQERRGNARRKKHKYR